MFLKLKKSILMYSGLPQSIYYVALARMVLGMGNFIIPFLVLLLTEKLGYSATVAGSLAMLVTAAFLAGGFVGGKLSDHFGHKRVMVAGECVGSLFLMVCGFYPESATLVPALLFMAYFCIGIALPASNALVADLSSPTNRDAVISLSYLTYNLGSAVGPIIAGYLFWTHTHWIYWGNGIATFLGITVVAVLVKLPQAGHETGDSDLEKPVQGSVWAVLKDRPRLIVFTFLCGLLWFALNQMTMTSPLYLSDLYGSDGPVLFGQLMTLACVLVVILTPWLITLTSTKTETMSLVYAGIMFAFGYALIMATSAIPIIFIAWFFLSAGEVLLLTKEGVYLANHSPVSHRGRIQGVLMTLRSVLLMPSFILVGYSIDEFGYDVTWYGVILVALLAVVGFYVMGLKKRAVNTSTA
ncbi:MFS transporter [Vibrio cionasavignyae]|uniref:MFS transporter n=1 Tax=Vibrio cionasavignyae TaxID=2910252 RepID=UPI003D099298